MARTPHAPVSPALLIWARESIGLSSDEAAKKVNVTAERLKSWEAGHAAPTVAQLRGLAKAYKRPLAVFFLPEPPRDFMPLHDFRRVHGVAPEPWSPGLRLALRRAEQQQEVVTELRELVGERPPARLTVSSSTVNPETFAAEARGLLGVSLETQTGWRDRYKALTGWVTALENAGVLVLQASDVPLEEMRGFAISDPVVPVIVLNGADAPRGRIFTALHEWTHLLLNEAGVCDLHDAGEDHDDQLERFCNEVAGAILLPRGPLEREPAFQRILEMVEITDHDVNELANRYSVSQEAVVRRLVSLGAISWDAYMDKRAEYQESYARRRSEEEGFAPYHRVRVRDLGRYYTRLVLDAYHGDRINVSDVSDYLGIRLKHLPKIEREALFG